MKKGKRGFVSWYYSLTNEEKDTAVELTVCSFYDEGHMENSIIIDSNKKELCQNIRFQADQLKSSKHEITAGSSHFSQENIYLDIQNGDYHLKGDIRISKCQQEKETGRHSSIMGPFKFLPFLKFYQEVLSLNCILSGSLWIQGKEISLDGGRGYVEREWGRDYPKIWIWGQCNHFQDHEAAIMFRVARVSLLWEYYTCFSVPVYYDGVYEEFSNYNGGQIAKLYRDKGYIHLIITQKSKVLDLKVCGRDHVPLMAARGSHNIRDVYKCQMSKIEIKITQNSHLVFEDTGICCNLEMGGNTSKLK